MKRINLFLLLSGLMVTVLYNSCKKEGQSPIQGLFTSGSWQLASILVFNYTGNILISTDTLNTTCDSVQRFTFTGNTCTYTNFDCIAQKSASATWTLSPNQLFLYANVVCKDTTKAGSSMPFTNAAIQNLGQFSLVLQTGDIQPNYSLTKPRRIMQYGFINIKALGTTP
jgi:hypothetical protein